MKILCLVLLLAVLPAGAASHALTLHFLPSPKGLDWSTPRALAWSAIKNRLSFEKRFIGHVFVELNCGEKRELTGMSAKSFDYLTQLFIENRGLGVLYHSFAGKLEEKSDIEAELQGLQKEGKVRFSRFILNEGQCARLTQYLKEYREHNVGKNYGLANRPLYGEGAGCSAFGVSFLEVAGIFEQEYSDQWSNFVNIPPELAGPPLKDEGVSFFKLLFSAKWAAENENHHKLAFWDPDRMFHWAQEKLKKPLPSGVKAVKIENAQGLEYDKSQWPVPEHPIWRQHTDPSYSKK